MSPVHKRAIHEPTVAGEFLAKFDPVVGAAVFGDLQGAYAGSIRIIVGRDAVSAAGNHGRNLVGAKPIQVVLGMSIKVIVAGQGPAHCIPVIALFDTGARADDALAAGVPKICVVQTVIVAEFVGGHASVETVAQPGARSAHIAHAAPAPAGHRTHASDVQIIIGLGIPGQGGGVASVSAELVVIVVGAVPGGGFWHAQSRRDIRTRACQREARPAVGHLCIESVQRGYQVGPDHIRKRRSRQV